MIRKRVFHLLLVLFTLLFLEGHAFAADTQIPTPVGDIYVQDFADVLTADEENQLKSIGRGTGDLPNNCTSSSLNCKHDR